MGENGEGGEGERKEMEGWEKKRKGGEGRERVRVRRGRWGGQETGRGGGERKGFTGPMSKCFLRPSTVEHCSLTFTFIQIFFFKILPSLLNGIRVAAFALYSVKIRVIFGVRSERRKVDKK